MVKDWEAKRVFGVVICRESKYKMVTGEKLFLLDIRTQNKWDKGYIECSRRIYMYLLEKHPQEVLIRSPIFLIYKSRNSSSIATNTFLRDNLKNIFNLLGGITA